MNVFIKPTPPKPTDEESIWINGDVIGVIKESVSPYFKYHAVLNSEVDHGSIYQGFGETHDEAMRDAIKRSKEKHAAQLIELDQIENLIWGDYATNE